MLLLTMLVIPVAVFIACSILTYTEKQELVEASHLAAASLGISQDVWEAALRNAYESL